MAFLKTWIPSHRQSTISGKYVYWHWKTIDRWMNYKWHTHILYVRNIITFLVFCGSLSVQYLKCRVVQVNILFRYDSWNLTIGNNIIYVFVIYGIYRNCTRNGFPDRRRPTHRTQTERHSSCNMHAVI